MARQLLLSSILHPRFQFQCNLSAEAPAKEDPRFKRGSPARLHRAGALATWVWKLCYGHEPPTSEMVSTRHPGAPTASSVPMRQRRMTVCPLRLGPRFITVLM
jgi:hypothetical protein